MSRAALWHPVSIFVLYVVASVLLGCASRCRIERRNLPSAADQTSLVSLLSAPGGAALRLPTGDELPVLAPRWPRVRPKDNALYHYLRAAQSVANALDNSRTIPDGSLESQEAYAGDRQALRRWICRNSDALSIVRHGLALEECSLPPLVLSEDYRHAESGKLLRQAGDLQIEIPGATCRQLRHLARLLLDAAFLEELEGKNDAAAELYVACLKMLTHLRKAQISVLLDYLSIDAALGLQRLMANKVLSTVELSRVAEACSNMRLRRNEIQNSLSSYGMLTHWRLFALMHGQSDLDTYCQNQMTDQEAEVPRLADLRDKVTALSRSLRVAMELPIWGLLAPNSRFSSLVAAVWSEANGNDLESHFGRLLVPPRTWVETLARIDVAMAATQLQATLAMYERKHGAFPKALSAVGVDLLPYLPKDAFSGRPLNYSPTEYGWRLWSVGPDLKDDEGTSVYVESNFTGPDYVFCSVRRTNESERRHTGPSFRLRGQSLERWTMDGSDTFRRERIIRDEDGATRFVPLPPN